VTTEPHAEPRSALEAERHRLEAELADLGYGETPGPEYDSNFADTSQVTAERGEAEILANDLRDALDEVEVALGRIEDGTYGTCGVCHEPIGAERLEAMPATAFCIRHAASN
jgi:RNA polymerase-binding transcription factor DksA